MKEDIGQSIMQVLYNKMGTEYVQNVYLKKRQDSFPKKYLNKDPIESIKKMYKAFYGSIADVISNTLKISTSVLCEVYCEAFFTSIYWNSEDVLLYRISSDPKSFYFISENDMKKYMLSVYNQMLDAICSHIEGGNNAYA